MVLSIKRNKNLLNFKKPAKHLVRTLSAFTTSNLIGNSTLVELKGTLHRKRRRRIKVSPKPLSNAHLDVMSRLRPRLKFQKNGRNCFALAEINMRADPSLGFVDP